MGQGRRLPKPDWLVAAQAPLSRANPRNPQVDRPARREGEVDP